MNADYKYKKKPKHMTTIEWLLIRCENCICKRCKFFDDGKRKKGYSPCLHCGHCDGTVISCPSYIQNDRREIFASFLQA